MSLTYRSVIAIFCATCALFFLSTMAPTLHAQGFVVNSTGDAGDASPGDGICSTGNTLAGTTTLECTLRAAIQEANARAGAHKITVPSGQYNLTNSYPCPASSGGVHLHYCLTGQMNIVGAGIGKTILDAGNTDRVVFIGPTGNVQISGVTVQNGHQQGGDYDFGGGGGIDNQGTAVVSDSLITGNRADVGGGGFYNGGTLTIKRTTVSNCSGQNGGGLYNHGGTLTIADSTSVLNTAGNGGALWNLSGPTSITGSTFSGAGEKSHGSSSNEYPGQHWTQVKKPEDQGWSSEKLVAAKTYADSIDTAAVVIVDDGVIVSQWGATTTKFKVHSVRKSFLNALYGIAVAKEQIDLNATLDQLRIDDNAPSLTPEEKQARVIDLLKARSGIYHVALAESPRMKAERPQRGSHPARSFWYYNNWDFNALGTIYEKLANDSIYNGFATQIAQPIGMEDYDPKEQTYETGPDSIHRAYPFRMSARDMARFGLLYLRGGKWGNTQLVPSQWVRDSTTAYSVADGNAGDSYSGYGYLWWVAINGNHYPKVDLPDGSFSAWGAGGHFIAVIPAYHLVVVHRVNTDDPAKKVTLQQFGELLRLILAARNK